MPKKCTNPQSYTELAGTDERRRVLLAIQAGDGAVRIMFHLWGSVLPDVLLSFDFWSCLILYLCARVLLAFEFMSVSDIGEFRGLHTMGVLLAFMMNFYVNTSIARLFQINAESMSLVSVINSLAALLRGMLWATEAQRDSTRRIVDYLCASHTFGYIGLGDGVYTTENLWAGINGEFALLTPSEVDLVMTHRDAGGSRYRECLNWAMFELHNAVKDGIIPPPIANGIYNYICSFQDSMQAIFDFKYQPIPFASEHLLVLFMKVYLPLQTFEMAHTAQILRDDGADNAGAILIEIFGLILAILANAGFQGLFLVGGFIENPFGGDLPDFRVRSFCRMAIRESRQVLCCGDPRTGTKPMSNEQAIWRRCQTKLLKMEPDANQQFANMRRSDYGVRYMMERVKSFEDPCRSVAHSSQSDPSVDDDHEPACPPRVMRHSASSHFQEHNLDVPVFPVADDILRTTAESGEEESCQLFATLFNMGECLQ